MAKPAISPSELAMDAKGLDESDIEEILQQEVLRPPLGGLPVRSIAEQEPYLNGLLIFGQSKVGKTVLACSAAEVPEMCPVLLIDFNEKGTRSARKFDVDVVAPSTLDECNKVIKGLRDNPGRYRTVILDSLTEAQYQIMNEVMVEAVRDPDNKIKHIEVPSQREWGIVLKRMLKLVNDFRAIPNTHMIFLAGATISTDSDSRVKAKMITPELQGKSAFAVPRRMDDNFYYYVKEVKGKQERVLWTAHSEDILAGSREGSLEETIQNPTMTKLFPMLVEKAKRAKAEKEDI